MVFACFIVAISHDKVDRLRSTLSQINTFDLPTDYFQGWVCRVTIHGLYMFLFACSLYIYISTYIHISTSSSDEVPQALHSRRTRDVASFRSMCNKGITHTKGICRDGYSCGSHHVSPCMLTCTWYMHTIHVHDTCTRYMYMVHAHERESPKPTRINATQMHNGGTGSISQKT